MIDHGERTDGRNGLNGSHYESLLGAGIPLAQVLALASAASDVRDVAEDDAAPPSPVASTIRSPRGLVVAAPSPIHVVVAA